jgi:uncharacterized membrane protein YccC
MSSTGTRVARRIVGEALRLNWAGLEVRYAVRCTAGVAIPLIVSGLVGQPLAGASAAYGALVTGLASRQGVYRTRVGAMLAASAALAFSAFAGAATGTIPVLNIVLLAVWTMLFGVVGVLGRSALVVSVNACVAFVIFSNAPYDTGVPAFHGLAVFGGGVLQMLLLVLVWPLGHFRAERSALAGAFSALSKYATGVHADDFGLPDTQSVSAVTATLADPQPFGSRAEIAAYQALADEAERLRGTLAALATEQQLLVETGMGDIARLVRNALVAAGPLLDELAAALAAGRSPGAFEAERRALAGAVRELERTPSDTAPYVHDGRALVSQLRAAMRSATAASNGGLVVGDVPLRVAWPNATKLREMASRLLANYSWDSSYARHAIRLTVTLTIAVIAQHLLPLAHAQWIGLTVILVLRPDFATTFTRGVARVAGTVGGAVLASIVALFHPTADAYIALAIVYAGCAFALFNVSYAIFSLAITGYIVYLLAYGGANEHASALDRVVATVIGGLLALIAYGAWPAWTHSRVGDDLADLIDAQRRYIGAVLLGFAEADSDEKKIRAAQVAVWRARSNAQASVDSMAGEPVRPRGITIAKARNILSATRRLGIAALTLHARVVRITGAPHALIDQFAGDLDIALHALVHALRNGEAPAVLPPLRADQIALRRALDERGDPAVEVIVAETDLIVSGVEKVAGILGF